MKKIFFILISLLFVFPVFAKPENLEDVGMINKLNEICEKLDEEPYSYYLCYDASDLQYIVSSDMSGYRKVVTFPSNEYRDTSEYPIFVVIAKNKETRNYSGYILLFEGYKIHLLNAPL